MLEVRDLTQRFGGLTALNRVRLNVPSGKVIGLIGPNGAGKTTLINAISGLAHPTEGQIFFENRAIQRMPPHRITQLGISRTYQNIRLFGEMTVLDNLIVAQHGLGHSSILGSILTSPGYRAEQRLLQQRAGALLTQFELSDKASQRAGALPYGDQRRLEMARALATHPKLLLLDEPTAGMNPIETEALGAEILELREKGLAVLVIEHDMALIHQVCDEIYVLNFGQIIAHGTPDQIKNNPLVIEAYLGEEE